MTAADPVTPQQTRVAAVTHLLAIDHREEKEAVLLRMTGNLDLHTVLSFRDAAFTTIGKRPPHFCLDLSALSLPDTSGLNSIVTVARVARLVDVAFTLIASDALGVLLRDTGLEKIASLEGVVEERKS